MQTTLPVDSRIDEIVALARTRRRLVIVAPPGAGKTTRIPPALASIGRTILLQPRRVAARALARRIAFERGWTVGREVGWQIRFERKFSADTRLLVATEGILTARLQSDPLLSDFEIVILDEFHERSIHADLALALVRQAGEARNDLIIVVMSATIDPIPVAQFISGTVIEVEARAHPIDVRHLPGASVRDAVHDVARTAAGHVLCFLPGKREIEDARTAITLPNVLPLHGSLDVDAQERVLAPSTERKIILATNIAETSLTVDGVTDVIDSGLQKTLRFDPSTAVDHLVTERISLDSARQRAGRAGRTGPGRAWRLWDERLLLRPQREPEVQRIDLSSVVLDVLAWGGDPETFEWFEAPPTYRVDAALELLRRLGTIDGGALTPLGRTIHRVPLHPRLAAVLIAAHGAKEAIRICAHLSDSDERELTQIARHVLGNRYRAESSEEDVRRALLAGYPDRVAVRRAPRSPRLLLSSGTGATLARDADTDQHEWLIALDVAGAKDGAEALVRLASPIERDWLAPTHHDVTHSLEGDRVRAVKRVWYGAIVLHEQSVSADPQEARELLARTSRDRTNPAELRRLALAGPSTLTLPSGRSVRLDYREDGTVFASVKLQELFGLAETPRVGRAQVPVTFELLAPNGRPVQITRDLRSFWNTTYADVRKELRGRYPKHPWPEDPWENQKSESRKQK